MKYLFAAIDARQNGTLARKVDVRSDPSSLKFSASELKKLMIEANEGVDEKTSTHDFVDTLERIVGEIRNTTEHSTAFLQKVKKHEAPDYYTVITRPMDLATLLKRVKAQLYNTKKAFADDLDLIWSNCLAYNSHPAHPLRRSAEILRQKSNQLLEFITDPSLPTRPLFNASITNVATPTSNSKRGTPGLGDDGDGEVEDEADVEVDSDEEDIGAKGQKVGRSGMVVTGAAKRLLNEEVGDDARERSVSPAGSQSETLNGDRQATRKVARGRTARMSPSRGATQLAFEERVAIVRTPQGMQNFTRLDEELSRIDSTLGYSSVASTSSLLPSQTAPAVLIAADSTSTDSATTSALVRAPTARQNRLLALVRSINPLAPTPPASQVLPPAVLLENISHSNVPETLWWETVTSSSSALALASGLPLCGFEGQCSTTESTAMTRKKDVKRRLKTKREGKAKAKGRKGKEVDRKGTVMEGNVLGEKMQSNIDTLKVIRRLHRKLADGNRLTGPETDMMDSELSESDDTESEGKSTKRSRSKKPSSLPSSFFIDAATIPPLALQSHLAGQFAQGGLRSIAAGVLAHTGFEGSSTVALDIIAHVTAEYITNLGRTLRFYSDRHGRKMTSEQILLHVLQENGVPSPGALNEFVKEDVDRYGVRLNGLKAKLQKAREDQLDQAPLGAVIGDHDLFMDNSEALLRGEFTSETGDDFFALHETGIAKELGLSSIAIPKRLFRGEPRGENDVAESGIPPRLPYPAPPPSIPLDSQAILSQIGLLRPFFLLRHSTDAGLSDDQPAASASSSTSYRKQNSRHKVAVNGKIPIRAIKRKVEESVTGSGGMGAPSKRKRKKMELIASISAPAVIE